ncbi:MAG: DUF309 domain-containing protein [Sulfurovaceae bacterium]|nr:DUF309 domain-containing protein [Sulfurovaceae bacterium]
MNIDDVLQKFIILLDNKEYFQAHSVLEEVWRKMKSEHYPCVNLVRGLINAAVAFEHIKRDTPRAIIKAHKTFAGYVKYRNLCQTCDDNLKKACRKVDEIASKAGL